MVIILEISQGRDFKIIALGPCRGHEHLGKVSENSALLGYYAVSSGNSLPMFWDHLSVPREPLKMGIFGCPETVARNYHYSLHKSAVIIYFTAEA
jgi:hypothetical protein